MTVSSAYAPNITDGDGVTVIFPITFRFDATSDVRCTIYAVDGTPRTPTFIVTGTGDPGGSLEITDGAPLAGEKVVRERVTLLRQPTNYTAGDFPSEAHEDSADRLVMMAQERDAIAGRTLRLGPLTEPIEPIPAVAVGRTIIRTLTGFAEGPTGDEVANAQTHTEAAIAAAVAAALSAVAAALSAGQAATFNPALYLLKASAAAISGPWTFSSTVKFGATGLLQFGAADEAAINYDAGLKLQADNIQFRNLADTATMLAALAGGGVQLYHNNLARLLTTAAGIQVTGEVSAETIAGGWIASQTEAEAGLVATKVMTPLSVMQVIVARGDRGRVLLMTASLSNVAVADFTGLNSTLYNDYDFELDEVLPVINLNTLWVRLSPDYGTGGFSALLDYGYQVFGPDGNIEAETASAIALTRTSRVYSDVTDRHTGVNGSYRIKFAGSSTKRTRIFGHSFYDTNFAQIRMEMTTGKYRHITGTNGLRFMFSSGNILSGTIRMYGYRV